MIKKI